MPENAALTYALVTLSYAPDFERCRLLHESVQQFVTSPHRHYIIVDRRDLELFSSLKDSNTQVLAVEDLIPGWIMRMPFNRKWWLSFKSPPIRNWIFQQIVKLGFGRQVTEDVLVFFDSDVAFIKPFDLSWFEKDGRTRLFRIPGGANIPSHYRWHRTAAHLLGIPAQDYFGARFIGNGITWRREHVLQLHDHLQKVHGRDWMTTMAWQLHLSEYILYGVFVDQVLKEKSLHYEDKENFCLEYWLEKDMSDRDVDEFLSKLEPHHSAIMLSSKAPIDPQRYQAIVQRAEAGS